MAGFGGSALYLAFGGTVLDTDYRSWGADETIEFSDISAGADTNKTYVANLKDGTATATLLLQASDTTTWGALVPGTSGSLEWADEGTASAKARHYVTAFVSGRSKAAEYAGESVFDVSWQFSGAVTDTTY